MRQVCLAVLTAGIALGMLACGDEATDTTVGVSIDGQWQYTAWDTLGVQIVEGWFTIERQDKDELSGNWHFAEVGEPENIGPHVGEGFFVGNIGDGGDGHMELQPQNADNNLSLVGTWEPDRFVGEWNYVSFIGVANHGPFEAEFKGQGVPE